MKIVGTPTSWGVYGMSGRGFQMNPDRVFSEVMELELTATEFGPQDWLSVESETCVATVKARGLTSVDVFFLVMTYDLNHDPIPVVRAEPEASRVAGESVLVLTYDSGREGYDSRPVLGKQGRAMLHRDLDRIAKMCAASGVTACVHSYQGTMVQNVNEVEQILDEAGVGLCLDTGHLMADGTDPAGIVRRHPERVAIAHTKDVHKELTNKLLTGELTRNEGIRTEMFASVGDDGVDFATIVSLPNGAGFGGYWVLEQDIMLNEDPALGEDLIHNARRSLKALKSLAG